MQWSFRKLTTMGTPKLSAEGAERAEVWGGVSPPQPTRGSGERRELPQRGPGLSENGFWRILKATERSFLYLYDKNLRGTICTSVNPTLNSAGDLSTASPVIYAHGSKQDDKTQFANHTVCTNSTMPRLLACRVNNSLCKSNRVVKLQYAKCPIFWVKANSSRRRLKSYLSWVLRSRKRYYRTWCKEEYQSLITSRGKEAAVFLKCNNRCWWRIVFQSSATLHTYSSNITYCRKNENMITANTMVTSVGGEVLCPQVAPPAQHPLARAKDGCIMCAAAVALADANQLPRSIL